MNYNNLILKIIINGGTLFLLFNSFVNIDLLKMFQIFILSSIVTNTYLLNKKKCNIEIKKI